MTRFVLGLVTVLLIVLMRPTTASGQYTFGDWARDQGYGPGDVMPDHVRVENSSIASLDGISAFEWNATPTTSLDLDVNQLSNIEPGTFDRLTNLEHLTMDRNRLTSIEAGDFRGLANLTILTLWINEIRSIETGAFSELTNLRTLWLGYNSLSAVESGDFDGLTNLTKLNLGGNQISSIESGAFSELTNLWELHLGGNQISSIQFGVFSGLTNMAELWLSDNQISSIESGAFSELTNLRWLYLDGNASLEELNMDAADFARLTAFDVTGNANITSVSLRNAVLDQNSLARLLDGGNPRLFCCTGIGELPGIAKLDLTGIDFGNIASLEPLYVMDDLTDLWLVGTKNMDAIQLDELLDNLETIEGTDTEGVLYMTQDDFDAFNTAGGGLLAWDAEPGHHVAIVPEPTSIALLLTLTALALARRRVRGRGAAS